MEFKIIFKSHFYIYFIYMTALGLAVSEQNIDIIKILLKRNDIDINILNILKNHMF